MNFATAFLVPFGFVLGAASAAFIAFLLFELALAIKDVITGLSTK